MSYEKPDSFLLGLAAMAIGDAAARDNHPDGAGKHSMLCEGCTGDGYGLTSSTSSAYEADE